MFHVIFARLFNNRRLFGCDDGFMDRFAFFALLIKTYDVDSLLKLFGLYIIYEFAVLLNFARKMVEIR